MLLKMSLSGGILILLIALVRIAALNKLPKRMFMLLWSVALLRLLVPAELPLTWGIALPVMRAAEDIAGKIPVSEALRNDGMGTDKAENSGISGAGQNYAFFIWLTGALTMLFILSAFYIREYRKIREALPIPKEWEEHLRTLAGIPAIVRLQASDRLASPVAFGAVRPKIVLPKTLQPEGDSQLKYVLIHEMVHIKRADNLRKMVMLLALCVHWFNPLVWMMYFLFNRDMELSCDEKVILLAGWETKKEYAMALVNLAEKQRRFSVFSSGFGKNAVKERIVAIMNFKKITVFGILSAVILTGVSVTVFAGGSNTESISPTYAGKAEERTFSLPMANSDKFTEFAKYDDVRERAEELEAKLQEIEGKYAAYVNAAENMEKSIQEVSRKD